MHFGRLQAREFFEVAREVARLREDAAAWSMTGDRPRRA
jgi:hypothetical protein